MTILRGPDVSTHAFGGVFDIDASGMYPGLEFINLVVCTDGEVLPTTREIKVKRVAHDFLRRLIHDDEFPEAKIRSVLLDKHSEIAISRLFRSLEIEVPNVSKAKSWERTHFFPYTRSLVHWDARIRGQNCVIERRYFRGGGAYAYSVLRHDPNHERLERVRALLSNLYPKEHASALDMLASTLRENGHEDSGANVDQVERNSVLFNDGCEELYREGVDNILSHIHSSVVERVKALINWTGIWTVIMFNTRASSIVGQKPTPFLIDASGLNPQLRRASQRCYKTHVATVESAIDQTAITLDGELSSHQFGKIRGYFGNTAAGCGLVNAWKGRRHYTLKLAAIDALVMAGVKNSCELEFEGFLTDWLYKKCGLLVGRSAARLEDLLGDLDASIFELNEKQFANQMYSSGMLRVFSDATRMVSYGGGR